MKFEFSRQIFKHYSNVKFHEKSVQWEQSCSMRTDRHYEANKIMLGVIHYQIYYRHNVFMVVKSYHHVLSCGVMWQTGTNIFAEYTASIFNLCSSNKFVPPYQTTACCHNTEGHDLYQISYQYTATHLLPAVSKWRVITRCRRGYGNVCPQNIYKRLCSSCNKVSYHQQVCHNTLCHNLPCVPT